jgi:hypothetical protein
MEAVDETMRTKDGDSADKATSDEEVKQKRSAKRVLKFKGMIMRIFAPERDEEGYQKYLLHFPAVTNLTERGKERCQRHLLQFPAVILVPVCGYHYSHHMGT